MGIGITDKEFEEQKLLHSLHTSFKTFEFFNHIRYDVIAALAPKRHS